MTVTKGTAAEVKVQVWACNSVFNQFRAVLTTLLSVASALGRFSSCHWPAELELAATSEQEVPRRTRGLLVSQDDISGQRECH